MNEDQKRWKVVNSLNLQIVKLRERVERLEDARARLTR